MLDWNDLKYFLSVADQGSTLAADRSLRVSQTTVARRIAALEEAIGFLSSEKRQAGYTLTPAGEELLERARQSTSPRQPSPEPRLRTRETRAAPCASPPRKSSR
jgi:DNA-binding transcriptional LysR family regulator